MRDTYKKQLNANFDVDFDMQNVKIKQRYFRECSRKLNSDLETGIELKNLLTTDNFTAFLGE